MRHVVLVSRASSVFVVALVALAACHHQSPAVAPAATPAARVATPPAPPPPPPPPPAPTPTPRALTDEELFGRQTVDELNAAHPLADALFAYDQSELRADARTAIAKDAAWLQKWPSTKLTISGHCDERGTAEFMALGERRAAAVSGYLQSLGVPASRIVTVSYGKERPFCNELAESCWSQNRRGHFLITAK